MVPFYTAVSKEAGVGREKNVDHDFLAHGSETEENFAPGEK